LSYVDELLAAYDRFVALPWQRTLAPPQRVWMAVYPPEQERRLRLHLRAFESATAERGHPWGLIDITTSFERWMAEHTYGDAYFEQPGLLETALPGLFDHLVAEVRSQLEAHPSPNGVVALLGAGALFGLGDSLKVSALLNAVNDAVAGRLLVFFPGDVENNRFRLLDARDGWDYMAIVIKPNGSDR
jgi:Domain of unknown function (DUF1788)